MRSFLLHCRRQNWPEIIAKLLAPTLNKTYQRLTVVIGAFLLVFFILVVKLQNLVFNNNQDIEFKKFASVDAAFRRANISDRNGQVLAVDLSTTSIYANPRIILDAQEAAYKICEIFSDLQYQNVLKDLQSSKKFVWLKRQVPPKQKYAVNKLGLPGIGFEDSHQRIYPHSNLLSHIVGFVGIDGMGLGGVEKYFDKQLIVDPSEGKLKPDIKLTLDLKVQFAVHEELEKALKDFKAIGAAAIVTDVTTGEIISMVSLPDFNPHQPGKAKPEQIFNRSSLASYELGSVFKSMTLAMALDNKTVSLTDAYDTSEPIKVARFKLRDFRGKGGIQSVPEIFLNSSNIGTAKISLDLGVEKHKAYLKKFGFMEDIKIEIPEIGSPVFPSNSKWSTLSTMTMSYGHGMMVTPLHMIRAFGGIVNDGVMHDLTLVQGTQTAAKQIISQNTSQQIKQLLRLNVTDGAGKKANAFGYLVGGKSGSAEKSIKGGYNRHANLSSFIAAFPIIKPKYAVFVILDEPKGNKSTFGFSTGGWTAAPVVGNIISRIANIIGIEPFDENDQEIIRKLMIESYYRNKYNESF
ncbi:peptidoglycan D,D-transpeptidase FtsI family protein [Rickettsiales endosymbiont of Stachyamoeba lipophora]|uniref:peptidoglycan D,D-transpeptidase FtsI family protein n=1 Tax=Rickettsiales endosymbiont of Stachyamoeba lipophora TaxID=2486578 RepID=UPI000F653C7F|nr:penicillin-binding protein 2 [Rickettsiales endosymbiont of Stachyamoeba lipophora]